MFDEVDVSTQIEVVAAGQKIVKPLVVPATNRKSIEELTKEIRAGQAPEPGAARRYRATLAFLSIPRPLRSVAWRAVMSNATWFKRLGGTVGLSSVGMFGPGGGWGIPIAPPTLMITVGGIATKPHYVDGNVEPRELLDLTITGVSLRLLNLIFGRLLSWLMLLGGATSSKDLELLVLRQRPPYSAEPPRSPGWIGPTEPCSPR